jgi:uncharacterized protein
MGRIVHFEITADDLDRAQKFYQEAFGWEINRWQGPMDYRLVMTGKKGDEGSAKEADGIDGAIMARMQGQAVINTVDVDDLGAMIEKVKAVGGQILDEPQEIPGVGRYVYAKDTEGNVFGMMQGVGESEEKMASKEKK